MNVFDEFDTVAKAYLEVAGLNVFLNFFSEFLSELFSFIFILFYF